MFHFNKSGKIRIPHTDRNALGERILERKGRLEGRMDMFNNFVMKEINRGNLIEAIDNYHYLTLGSLLEALRMKHNPYHFDFKTRYVHYELPTEVIHRLQHLYFVRDENDLRQKYSEATAWFRQTMSEIDTNRIRALVQEG